MNKIYITLLNTTINKLLDTEYSSEREKSRAVMRYILRHEKKDLEAVDALIKIVLGRKESNYVKLAILRSTFRYQHCLKYWGRLLYEGHYDKPSLLNGLVNSQTYLNYLRS